MNFERRVFFGNLAGASARFAASIGLFAAFLSSPQAQEDQANAIEVWMNGWMVRDKDVAGALHLSRFADPIYFLLKPITWKPNPDQGGYSAVTVPAGFVTDFASIPRIFWSVLRPDGLYTYPAIVHDYLYWTQSVSKEVADKILQFGMEDFGIARPTIATIYQAVNLAGGSAWTSNARLKGAGERRILRVLPSDPRVRWQDWKKNPEHF